MRRAQQPPLCIEFKSERAKSESDDLQKKTKFVSIIFAYIRQFSCGLAPGLTYDYHSPTFPGLAVVAVVLAANRISRALGRTPA
jgi:hypothetical protein